MRQDKLTTKFQEALSDAQTLALGNDNAYIEPAHLLVAMLRQEDGPRALLERAGVNVQGLAGAAEAAIKKLPQVQGHDIVQVGPELGKLLQATEKEAIKRNDQFIAGELFLLGRGRQQIGHRPDREGKRPEPQVARIGHRRRARRAGREQRRCRRPARSPRRNTAST